MRIGHWHVLLELLANMLITELLLLLFSLDSPHPKTLARGSGHGTPVRACWAKRWRAAGKRVQRQSERLAPSSGRVQGTKAKCVTPFFIYMGLCAFNSNPYFWDISGSIVFSILVHKYEFDLLKIAAELLFTAEVLANTNMNPS